MEFGYTFLESEGILWVKKNNSLKPFFLDQKIFKPSIQLFDVLNIAQLSSCIAQGYLGTQLS